VFDESFRKGKLRFALAYTHQGRYLGCPCARLPAGTDQNLS
jgi:hypothetical protein